MKNWDDLNVFLAVARQGQLTLAADQLKIDPATVGRRISRLEQDHNAQLFTKSPKGYALTEAGQGLLAHISDAESSILSGLSGLSDTHEGLSGPIRIGAPDGCANFILPQVCAQISADYPDLDIQIVALPRAFNLTRREADLAIGVSYPETGRLSVQKISDYKLHLAGAFEGPPPNNLSELAQVPFVGYIGDMIFDKELDYLETLGLQRVQMASNSVSVQLNLLRQGASVGVVHDFALPFAPELRLILTDVFSLTRSFFMIRSQDDQNNLRLNRFSTILIQGIRQEIRRLEHIVAAKA